MKQYLEKMLEAENLSKQEMKQAVLKGFSGQASDSELAAFLVALRSKGETAEEIAALVEVIREQSSFTFSPVSGVMDNCGTGGDGSHSFNISTTSAFVIAGAGVTVAKHGNRSISSSTGSADVLEALGVSLDFGTPQIEEILQENKIAFLYAPHMHQGLRRYMKVRRELRIPTIFNLIGPLTNPVQLDSQLVGIYRRDMLPMIAAVLYHLGRKRAVVVNGADHMDEASLAGENHLILMEKGEFIPFTIQPEELGLPSYENSKIKGGSARDNAEILLDVLRGKPGPYYDTVLLNAAIGLFANGAAATIQDGVQLARESLESGAALSKLEYLIQYSKPVTAGSSL
ncbi:anthranilate phosphoribosyltransferase [Ornithinibacillus gellani]|uniref:anthranilate phosphoribosyltransferase n=1 Tax=Ornithinibacillus gellani TaxID=2293253 RepID=UPI000F476E2D|nr:anthranilate phosphoribosyltransferase [Ornithinibacillus gellani]TQS70962.1 anthranilate phosphoribosyltransferase [Ornithinibacillus gellani]